MRHRPLPPAQPGQTGLFWPTLRSLAPYLWPYRIRISLALLALFAAKMVGIGVPVVFKELVDGLAGDTNPAVALPIMLVLLYGGMRVAQAAFTELRELLFSRVTLNTVREVALKVFRHLHDLSLRFHLERQTGGLTRDIERGTRAISSLIAYTLYSILPTAVEISMVMGLLWISYDVRFALITAASLAAYLSFTILVTNHRLAIRRAVNETDSAANAKAIDSLLNYETVKYFNNEAYEAARYDAELTRWQEASIRSQTTLSWLNIGQQIIIALGVTGMMWLATQGVADGSMTIGDLVLVNALLIQLYIPLNFLGMVYRELRQATTDIERLFGLLSASREVSSCPRPQPLPPHPLKVEFANVSFSYDGKRTVLSDISLTLEAGKTTAIVGPSGSGKSTLARLLFRFYDPTSGSILLNGVDLRALDLDAVRRAMGVVPQDTVLFNDSLRYNIAYARPDANEAAVRQAIGAAQLNAFVDQLPAGVNTEVGERGLKLSGGEKQRVAIARALLKDPPILIFDEATSSLDSRTEQAIQTAIKTASTGRTSLIIAHRLSTITHADQIIVLKDGSVIEHGHHGQLLAKDGTYADLWRTQQSDHDR